MIAAKNPPMIYPVSREVSVNRFVRVKLDELGLLFEALTMTATLQLRSSIGD
ncbi:MAG TPA: hypothetical protein VN845_03230 [Solirubrobacteraceae bacterium]|nr:hypothetical protein [Solirubrobacteraceae bacterium]